VPEIVIVTGPINSGKSTYLAELIARERESERVVSGVIAHGVFAGDRKIGYDVEDIAGGTIRPLARAHSGPRPHREVGRFSFSVDALEFARRALLGFAPGGVVFVDEIGPLELSGDGYAPCLPALFESSIDKLYIVVRESLVDRVVERFLPGQPVTTVRVHGR